MRCALAFAALVIPHLIPAAAAAQDEPIQMGSSMASLVRAEDVGDATIYSIANAYDEAFWESGEPFAAIAANWEEIGDAEDVLLGRDGRVAGVLVDVGGFLGIGDKEVLLPLDDIRLVPMDDEDLVIVTRMTREQLEEHQEVSNVFGED